MPKILIVDDNAYMRKAMTMLLQNKGHVIDTACDGREAVAKVVRSQKAKKHYDILITDLMMPEVDGHRLIDLIQKNARPLGIIAISGGDGMINPNSALDLVKDKVDKCLTKPFKHNDFVHAVELTIKNHWSRMAALA